MTVECYHNRTCASYLPLFSGCFSNTFSFLFREVHRQGNLRLLPSQGLDGGRMLYVDVGLYMRHVHLRNKGVGGSVKSVCCGSRSEDGLVSRGFVDVLVLSRKMCGSEDVLALKKRECRCVDVTVPLHNTLLSSSTSPL